MVVLSLFVIVKLLELGMGTEMGMGNGNNNGYIHKTIPSTPSVMSGLEKWGQDR